MQSQHHVRESSVVFQRPPSQEPQPTSYHVLPTTKPSKFNTTAASVFGICQIFLGSLVILFGIAAYILGSYLYKIATPLWCGVLFVLTGVVGLVSSFKTSNGMILASMVMSLVTAVFAGLVLLTMESITVDEDNDGTCVDWDLVDPKKCLKIRRTTDDERREAINGMLIFLSIAVAILAVFNMVFSWRALSRGEQNYANRVKPAVYLVSGSDYVTDDPRAQVVMLPAGVQQVNFGHESFGQPVQPTQHPYYDPVHYYHSQSPYVNSPLTMKQKQQQQQLQQQRRRMQEQQRQHQAQQQARNTPQRSYRDQIAMNEQFDTV
ncbi:uncharacterized protein LOC144452660 [Glandiceps talaboti]